MASSCGHKLAWQLLSSLQWPICVSYNALVYPSVHDQYLFLVTIWCNSIVQRAAAGIKCLPYSHGSLAIWIGPLSYNLSCCTGSTLWSLHPCYILASLRLSSLYQWPWCPVPILMALAQSLRAKSIGESLPHEDYARGSILTCMLFQCHTHFIRPAHRAPDSSCLEGRNSCHSKAWTCLLLSSGLCPGYIPQTQRASRINSPHQYRVCAG